MFQQLQEHASYIQNVMQGCVPIEDLDTISKIHEEEVIKKGKRKKKDTKRGRVKINTFKGTTLHPTIDTFNQSQSDGL